MKVYGKNNIISYLAPLKKQKKYMLRKITLSISLLAILSIISCKKEEESKPITPPRDVTEVRDENDAAITNYLKTHFHTFKNNEVVLDTIAGANANQTSLMDLVKTIEIDAYDANNKKVRHKLYYLPVQEGTGMKSSIADSVYIAYRGQLLKGIEFDRSVGYTQSNWFDLLGDVTNPNAINVIRGFRHSIAELKDSASEITVNVDGTIQTPTDGGVGVFFMPSRLAYFNTSKQSIPAYSPLMFTIHLIKTKRADHDRDGKPSLEEIQVDNYGIITYTNCDNDSHPDYLDADTCK